MLRIDHHGFEEAAGALALGDDEVHLWLFDVSGPATARALSALAHAELGRRLQAYAGSATPPALARAEHGKPYALDPAYPRFNLSHGGSRIALAFARDVDVGIDVDATTRRRGALALAERFFAAEETSVLAALAPERREEAFMHLWTCKEAVLKAVGRGLAFGLDRLRFGFDEAASPEALVAIADEAGTPDDWNLARFDAGEGHAGALAWRGGARRVRAFRGAVVVPGG